MNDLETLQQFVDAVGGNVPTVARMLGVRNRASIYEYLSHGRVPGPVLRCIELYNMLPQREFDRQVKRFG